LSKGTPSTATETRCRWDIEVFRRFSGELQRGKALWSNQDKASPKSVPWNQLGKFSSRRFGV
jgi:hypothetical protein